MQGIYIGGKFLNRISFLIKVRADVNNARG